MELRFTLIRSLALIILLPGMVFAQEQGQKTFANPQDAGKALYEAAKSGDKSAIEAVLGASSSKILSSGDEVQDKNGRDTFIQRYEQMNRWAKEVNGEETLIVGVDNWPFPIPLKDKAGAWYFDTPAGEKEILFRRIGRNEIAAIRVCYALTDAQEEYFGLKQQYAQKIISDPGQQDGLYWKTAEGESESPIGPLVAEATSEGYGGQHDTPQPFHGYFYRILTAQGANAAGGAKQYVADGKMTGGFAFVAWPAEYRNSGVMTFLIDQDGVVYQKNLGPQTSEAVKAMTTYNPDKSWKAVWAEEDDQ
ncbi:MAG TPA: DUF2950 domain-containing protein [Bryocella sp.]|nr:DUF2950 domain-containing protein [Bryocella sp.]